MLSSFSSPLNSIPDIPGIISVVTAGIISVVGIILVVIGGHFGGGDHFDGGDHFGGGTGALGAREMRRVHEEGGSDFNIHLVAAYDAKKN